MYWRPILVCFFFNDTATTEIYTLSLHDALPISWVKRFAAAERPGAYARVLAEGELARGDPIALEPTLDVHLDRKSTRLNSSHANISYAVFCLIKKKTSCRDRLNTRLNSTLSYIS